MFLRHFGKSALRKRQRNLPPKNTDQALPPTLSNMMEPELTESCERKVGGKAPEGVSERGIDGITGNNSEIQTICAAEEVSRHDEAAVISDQQDSDLSPLDKQKFPLLASLRPNEILLSNVPEDTTLVVSAMETIFETSDIEFKPEVSVAIIRFETEDDALLAMDIARTFQLNELEQRHIVWCNDMMTSVLRIENISRDTMEDKIFSDFPDLKSVKLKHLSNKCVAVMEFESPYIAAKNYAIAKRVFGRDAEVYHVVHSDWRYNRYDLDYRRAVSHYVIRFHRNRPNMICLHIPTDEMHTFARLNPLQIISSHHHHPT